ncbi:MAG: HesA/MoeB/ThiF family protein [Spirochaetota bacterium]
MLSDNEKERYRRQILLPEVGETGQEKLKEAIVFIAGAGGLGSPAAMYLSAAGIGQIRICDSSTVELSNLNRQLLHYDTAIGREKVVSAKETLLKINPHCTVIPLCEKITENSVAGLVDEAQILIDCLDNFETRYILNSFVVKSALPFVHAGVLGMAGQMTFIHTPETPCLQCIFPEAAAPGELFPIIGATAGVIGALEALEVIKYLAGIGPSLKGRLLIWEGESNTFHTVEITRDSACPVCGQVGLAEVQGCTSAGRDRDVGSPALRFLKGRIDDRMR